MAVNTENQSSLKEEKVYAHHVTIFGKPERYSWETGASRQITHPFSGFRTMVGEEQIDTQVGLDAENNPIAIIGYDTGLSTLHVNCIINHILTTIIQGCQGNDKLYHQQEAMTEDNYVVLAPVMEMVSILHSWANIAFFQPVEQIESK